MASTNSIILASVRFMQFFHLCLKKAAYSSRLIIVCARRVLLRVWPRCGINAKLQ